MIDLDIAEFSLGVAESAGDKSVSVNCAMMRELVSRLRQAEKDAARYRWLKEKGRHDYDVDDFFDGSCDRIDSKVDEAMQCNK